MSAEELAAELARVVETKGTAELRTIAEHAFRLWCASPNGSPAEAFLEVVFNALEAVLEREESR